MTKQELNRDVKRLYKKVESMENTPEYYDFIDNEFSREFKRLYNADREFEYMNKQSILIMLRMNLRYRIIPFRQFGTFIKL